MILASRHVNHGIQLYAWQEPRLPRDRQIARGDLGPSHILALVGLTAPASPEWTPPTPLVLNPNTLFNEARRAS